MFNPTKLLKLRDPEIRAKNILALKRALRGYWWDITKPKMPDPVFLVGCSRSGTTITYETLAAAPNFLSFGYEILQFWDSLYGPHTNDWASEAATARDADPKHREATFRFFYQRLGVGQVLDKTCINVMRIPYLIELFPDAKFVFIHRDGRDNISSMIDGWRQSRKDGRFGLTQYLGPSPEPVAINDGEFTEWCFFLPPGWREYNSARLEDVCAFQWISANHLALEGKKVVPPDQWIQVKYEDMVADPIRVFGDIFTRLGVPFDDKLKQLASDLDRRPTSIVNGPPQKQKWKKKNPKAIERIIDVIQPMMIKLGYDIND